MDRDGAGPWAIAGQDLPEVRQPCLGTVTLDQLGDVQPAAPLAPGTGTLQHGQPAGDLSQSDRAAAAHRRRFFASTAPWRDLGVGVACDAVGRGDSGGSGASFARISCNFLMRGDVRERSRSIVSRSSAISAAFRHR
jgi:hypothetical protein